MHEILSVAQMYRADSLAMESGISGLTLMEAAGSGIAEAIQGRWNPCPVEIWCGPGNNGGDGFVVARLLGDQGWPVRLFLLGDADRLKGDAAVNAARWRGGITPLETGPAPETGLVVDALFGAGLARPLSGVAAEAVAALNASAIPRLAVDVPSGVQGDTGLAEGVAVRADMTVTFCRAKPGHLLYPGRGLCGELSIVDIGIGESVIEAIGPRTWRNGPGLWRQALPVDEPLGHKYSRGHLAVVGGSVMTGAARLAARGARRMGAGLVSLAMDESALPLYAGEWPGTILRPLAGQGGWTALLADHRVSALVLGPGGGVNDLLRDRVMAALATDKPALLDADALTVFADHPDRLFAGLADRHVLTPHGGEFARLFPAALAAGGGKLEITRQAAVSSGAVVVHKGPDTVIAHPDGRAAINADAPASLATGGSGDVLAGMIGALLARGMDSFQAACAGVWLHGRAAADFGPGLIAEDLPDRLPAVRRQLDIT